MSDELQVQCKINVNYYLIDQTQFECVVRTAKPEKQ